MKLCKTIIFILLIFLIGCNKSENSEKSISDKMNKVNDLPIATLPAFNSEAESLPKKYTGHFHLDVTQALEKVPKLKKDEFETTAQFEKRKQELLSKPIPLFGELTTESLLAFTPIKENNLKATYDADLQSLSVSCQSPTLISDNNLNFIQDSKLHKSIVLSIVDMSEHKMGTSYSYLALNSESSWGLFNQGNFSIKLTPEIARQVKPNLMCLYIGHVIYPFTTTNYYFGNGYKLDVNSFYDKDGNPVSAKEWEEIIYFNLEQVWIYDFETGEILLKFVTVSDSTKRQNNKSEGITELENVKSGTKADSNKSIKTAVQIGGKSGEEVYKAVCSMCHASGLMNAPKFGDKAQWKPRIKQGVDVLISHAIKGIRAMPAKGGNPSLSDTEVIEAVKYMANASGASFN